MTALIVLCNMRFCSAVGSTSCTAALSCTASARSSTIIRHTRSKKPRTPLTPSMLHGLTASSGPMNISYSRSAVGPVFLHHLVGIDHVAAALRHLLAVLAQNHALVDQLLERLGVLT